MMSLKAKAALFAWFHVGWLGCVYFAIYGLSPYSLIFPLAGWILLRSVSRVSLSLALYLLAVSVVGMAFDALAAAQGLIVMTDPEFTFLPVWLISLWLLYVSVLPLFGDAFERRWALATALGFVFGPLSYYSGEAFGVLHFGRPLDIVVYGLFWAAFFPVSLHFQRKYL